MSGGLAYVLDRVGEFEIHCNKNTVDLLSVEDDEDINQLKSLVEEHFLYTQSSVAKIVLDEWEETLPKFIKVYPRDYRHIIEERKKKKQGELLVDVAWHF